jgi:hypothetical protein
MNAKRLDDLATVVADMIKRVIAPRDEKIRTLELKLATLEQSMAIEQRLKSLEQQIDQSQGARVTPRYDSPPDISDLIQ